MRLLGGTTSFKTRGYGVFCRSRSTCAWEKGNNVNNKGHAGEAHSALADSTHSKHSANSTEYIEEAWSKQEAYTKDQQLPLTIKFFHILLSSRWKSIAGSCTEIDQPRRRSSPRNKIANSKTTLVRKHNRSLIFFTASPCYPQRPRQTYRVMLSRFTIGVLVNLSCVHPIWQHSLFILPSLRRYSLLKKP